LLLLLVCGPCESTQGQPVASRKYLHKSAAQWLLDLRKDDAALRRSAAFALGKCGGDSQQVMKDLIKALNDSDEGVREAAAFAIGEIGIVTGVQAIKPLTQMLEKDTSAQARRAAAFALGRLGERAASAVPALRQALNDQDARVRQNAAYALGYMGDDAVAAATPDLARMLTDSDALVRRDVALALGNAGPTAKGAIPALIDALADGDSLVRQYSVIALGKMKSEGAPAVPTLVRLLEENTADRELWREALLALTNIGGEATVEAIPVLRTALKDADPLIREVAAATLLNLAKDRAEVRDAVPDLAGALTDPRAAVRRNVAATLALIALKTTEPTLDPVADSMLKALQDDTDRDVRLFLGRAFWAVDLKQSRFERTRAALIQVALKDREKVVRYTVANMLAGHLGPDAADVAPTLMELLKDRNISTAENTTARSSASGGESRSGGTRVEETGESDARYVGAKALGRIGRAAGPAAKRALEEAAKDPFSEKLREEAKLALEQFK
jgi:HEAT repeat protein